MMSRPLFRAVLLGAALALSGCSEPETGPVRVDAIGAAPELVNPNLQPLNPASAFLLEATAQGLVRFDASGEVEPALAQSWIVSDDGLRYTFRIRRAQWPDGSRVTAEQVAARLRAAGSRASRNPLKPVLGVFEDVIAMTDQVLEISLKGPRPNLLQLLAQPEMAIIMNGGGTGPFEVAEGEDDATRLTIPSTDDEDDGPETRLAGRPDILLRGEPAAVAAARFAAGETDLVTGGTVGNLPIVRAAGVADNRLIFDPAAGLFGLAFVDDEGPLAEPTVRAAMSMAIDRDALVAAIGVPGLLPRLALLPVGDGDRSAILPEWAASPMPMRREIAARTIAGLEQPLRVRVAMPDGPGYRLIFAYLRYDWRLVGIEAERVGLGEDADLRLVDSVAPGWVAGWYFRHFTCDAGPICDPEADAVLKAARNAPDGRERAAQLAQADRMLTALTPFIPLTTPVRWSLVTPRLTGFRPNVFARHPAGTLIANPS